ncbi:carbohydrate-binding domain-containing protein [Ruminococcus sp.]|uniref:carbohydrate-binding domain-containing protein n=1 Tax=Ruminococcus sp. TaxID=41978 RepID=UPI0025FEA3E3|nr:carbohydrate-binding domain-containing protein [Ruminococcus sp.]MBQ8966436.1 carbohydrate-binding domain-containing protein [Ruminococcus sp.]
MKINVMKRLAACAAAVTVIAMAGCAETGTSKESTAAVKSTNAAVVTAAEAGIEADDIEVGYEESDSVNIVFSDEGAETAGSGVSAEGTKVTITAAGTYVLSGSCADGQIVVEAGEKDKVKLVLDGLDLCCKNNAAVLVKSADKVFMLLEEGSENTLSDGESYDLAEGDNTDGAVFSKSDLTINGEGKLAVNGNYKHGIVSKDDLVITGGQLTVTAAGTALSGKDSVKISAGSFDITSGNDGIKSTNDEEEGTGIISVTGGSFTINAGGDGFSAAADLTITGGEFDITTGGGSDNASVKNDGTPNGEWQQDFGRGGKRGGFENGEFEDMGERPDKFGEMGERPENFGEFGDMGTPPDGFEGGEMGDMGTPPDGFGGGDMQPAVNGEDLDISFASNEIQTDEDSSTKSAKALKAGGNIVIEDGAFNIDSADDSLHCDGAAHISGGSLTASSGDDGIHVGGDLVIDGGTVDIEKSYEGIEGMTVTIAGGDISVTARDDGINCAGGSDTASEGRMGRDQFAVQEGVFLKISGGTLYVNSGGDGLDSNGDLYVEGGYITVSGPENNGNGSVDHNGSASITGGTIIASGAVGMEEMFEESGTTQCAVLHDFTSTFAAGTEFDVTDSAGNTILSFTNDKTWQGVIFSSPDLAEGESYTVTAGDESETITLEGVITSNGSGNGFGRMGGKGMF